MRILQFICLSILILPFANHTMAQYNEVIRTARPGQAIGPFTVGKHIFQNQSGVDYYDFDVSADNLSLPSGGFVNSVFRYGILENFEISAVLNYDFIDGRNGLTQADFGGRTNIHEGEGIIPSIGFQYRFAFPVKSGDFETINEDVQSRIVIITGQNITDKLGLSLNFGISWVTGKPASRYVASFSYSISEKVGMVAEVYGSKNFEFEQYDANVDGGFSYLLNNDLQLDLYGGYGNFGNLTPGFNSYFISTGVSWRVKVK